MHAVISNPDAKNLKLQGEYILNHPKLQHALKFFTYKVV